MNSQEYTTKQLMQISELYSMEILENKLRIIAIDKEFKKNNQEIISNAIKNVLGISIIICLLLNHNKNIQDIANEHILNLIDEMNSQFVPIIDQIDPTNFFHLLYLKLMGFLERIIETYGIFGISLASNAFLFITDVISGGKKKKKLKEEKIFLEQKIKDYEEIINNKSI